VLGVVMLEAVCGPIVNLPDALKVRLAVGRARQRLRDARSGRYEDDRDE
jgi:hypothetical protein